MSSSRLPALGTLALLATHALAGVAPADTDVPPWATINGSCSRGGTVTNQTGQAVADHPYPIARLSAAGGPASWIAGHAGPTVGFGTGDVVWSAMDPIRKGQSPASKVSCPESEQPTVPYRVEFFDAPVAPATFSGRITRVDANQWGSLMVFLAPRTAPYAADVEMRSGAARFCVYTPGRDFAAGAQPKVCSVVRESSTIPLGTVSEGPTVLTVVAEAGPPADYVVKARPLPIVQGVPTDIRVASRYLTPLADAEVSFKLSGDTVLSAAVVDASGRVVRGLGDRRQLAAGAHAITWDGRDAAGRRVDDGRYTVRLTVIEDGAEQDVSSPAIIADATSPTVEMRAPGSPRTPAVIRVGDATSGVARAVIKNGPLSANKTVATYMGRPDIRIPAPRAGWRSGATLHVTVSDRAGNTARSVQTVRMPRRCMSVPLGSRRALEVRALGTGCTTARLVVRGARRVPQRFTARSFACERSKGRRYVCKRGRAVIAFRVR